MSDISISYDKSKLNIALIGNDGLTNLKSFEAYYKSINIDQSKVRVIGIELDEPSGDNSQTNNDHADHDDAEIPDFKENDNVFIYHPSDIVVSQRQWREFAMSIAKNGVTYHIVKEKKVFKGQNLLKYRFTIRRKSIKRL